MASNYMVKVYADLIPQGEKDDRGSSRTAASGSREILENSENGAEGL